MISFHLQCSCQIQDFSLRYWVFAIFLWGWLQGKFWRNHWEVHIYRKIEWALSLYIEVRNCKSCKSFLIMYLNRVLSRSREVKSGKYDESTDIAEQHRLQSLQKAMAVQWLCFTPPSTIADVKDVSTKLLLRALMHRYFMCFFIAAQTSQKTYYEDSIAWMLTWCYFGETTCLVQRSYC